MPTEFLDETQFINGDWNHWQKGEAGQEVELVSYPDTTSKGLYYRTALGKKHASVILHKDITGLVAGTEYTFQLRIKRVIGQLTLPKLALRVNGKAITNVVERKNGLRRRETLLRPSPRQGAGGEPRE